MAPGHLVPGPFLWGVGLQFVFQLVRRRTITALPSLLDPPSARTNLVRPGGGTRPKRNASTHGTRLTAPGRVAAVSERDPRTVTRGVPMRRRFPLERCVECPSERATDVPRHSTRASYRTLRNGACSVPCLPTHTHQNRSRPLRRKHDPNAVPDRWLYQAGS